ncbi:MAG TPA: glyoxalase [Bosea sp. (in: a-proteobacteria)]|jgi:catechol 2,3-dioxygenase-like lactoylglutathione lyase family enzyme|nr:glyoxalase [Bosea sp. (in: a-proteobacteria)]
MHLDHVTFRTADVAGAAQFLRAVFDLDEGERPQSIRHIPGAWLYAQGKPVVHLIGSGRGFYPEGFGPTLEAIDHVGFHRDDYDAFRTRLERLGVPHSLMDLPEIAERRIFLRLPSGPLIEVVFDDPEAAAH